MASKNQKEKLIFIEPELTVTQFDYLAIIHEVRREGGAAKSSDVAAAAGVTRSTVSTTLKSLRAAGLITCESYGPIHLTTKGEAIAQNICAMREALADIFEDVAGLDERSAHRAAAAFKGAAPEQAAEQLALLRRFVQKNKKKWKKFEED